MNKVQKRDWVRLILDNFIWIILAVLFLYFAANVPNFTLKSNPDQHSAACQCFRDISDWPNHGFVDRELRPVG